MQRLRKLVPVGHGYAEQVEFKSDNDGMSRKVLDTTERRAVSGGAVRCRWMLALRSVGPCVLPCRDGPWRPSLELSRIPGVHTTARGKGGGTLGLLFGIRYAGRHSGETN